MPCPCEGPCEPQPFRCACQRDCWNGPPDDYETCLAACDPACSFPRVESLPSEGYRCPVWPTIDYTDCVTPCTEAREETNALCDTDRATCEGTCTGLGDEAAAACFAACAEGYCQCTGEAQTDYLDCVYPCNRDIAFPAAFLCLQSSIAEDETCCATARGTALYACESDYLSAAQTVELDWLECENSALPASSYHFDAESGLCITSSSANLDCAAIRLAAIAALELTRANCIAEADEAERRRDVPGERKFAECGVRQMCEDKCEATAAAAVSACGVSYLQCAADCESLIDPADVATCRAECATAYRECWIPADVARVSCRVECCKTDAPHTPNDHARADCRFDCYEDFIAAKVACSDALEQCRAACDDGDTACFNACETTFCGCNSTATIAHDSCLDACETAHRGDCPDCYTSALESTDNDDNSPLYTLGISIPDPLLSVACP